MECKCETCIRKDCPERTTQDDLRIVIGCDDYIEHKITNADRIRAMSDEELGEFVSSLGCVDHFKRCNGSCKKCTLDWLKQPAEVDND